MTGVRSRSGRSVRLALVASVLVVSLAGLPAAAAAADTTPQTLPFSQDWSNTGLITMNDNWSGVPGIVGYLGDDASGNDVDPQTRVQGSLSTTVDVIANQTSTTISNGGVAEFDGIANPTVALQGSGTADAPNVVLHLNTTDEPIVSVAYNLRDIDGSADNAVQQVALQYRVGSTGDFTNLAGGYVADATEGPSLASKVTPVLVTLPADAEDQPLVQVRIITSNATGSDEWVGIDDIVVSAVDAPPYVSGTNPADNATGVPGNSNVSVTFSEPVNVTGSWYSISCSSSGMHPATQSGGPSTFTLNPDADFVPDETCTVTVFGAQVTDQDADDPPDNMSGDFVFDFQTASPVRPIYEIQGDGATSPFDGTQQATSGVVTVILGSGFFMQDPTGDGESDTSDGIFVFSGSPTARTLFPGDEVTVTGTVTEFRPASRPRDLTLTEFSPATVTRTSMGGPVPDAVAITDRPDTLIDPDGIDTYEALEGMLVSIDTPKVSGATNDFGELVVAASGDHANMTTGGNFLVKPLPSDAVDYNPERIMVDDEARAAGGTGSGTRINNPMVPVVVGDTATGDIVGALDYQFSNYRVQANHLVSDVLTGSSPDSPVDDLRDPEPFEGRIATFNVENLFDCVDAPGKSDDHPSCTAPATQTALETQLTKLAMGFEDELGSPEIVIIEETENAEVLTGDANGNVPGTGPPGSIPAIQALLPRIAGNWDAASFDASDERGIEVAFVYNTDRVTLDDVFLATDVLPDGGVFSGSPTIRPGREPLVGLFTLDDIELIVVGNHLKSKGGPQFGVDPLEAGDDPLYGDFQPPSRWTETQLRHAQADYLRDLVDELLGDPANPESILVGGDLNDFAFPEPGEGNDTVARIMTSSTDPLTNIIPDVPEERRYTFIFEGNSQVLDHMLLNDDLAARLTDQNIAHFNTDFPSAFGTNPAVTLRSSDHDPLVAYFNTDATAPISTVTFPEDGESYKSPAFSAGCSTSGADVCGTATDAVGVDKVEVRIQRASDGHYWNGSAWQAGEAWLLATGTSTWSFDFTPGEDTYALSSRGTDEFGNVETPTSVTFTVDDTAPNTTIDSGPSGYTNDNTPTFTFSSNETGTTFECRVDLAAFASCSGPGASHTTGALSDGSHTFNARATDQAGNTDATPASQTFTVDVTDPSDPTLDSPSHDPGVASVDNTVDIIWSGAFDATSGVDGFSFLWDTSAGTVPDQVKDAEESASGTTSPALPDGASHWFHLSTRDNAGNWTSTVHLGPFVIASDTDPPQTTITSGPSGRTFDRTPRFKFKSDEPGSTFQCKLDNQAWKSCTSPKQYGKLSFGKHIFRVKATDPDGNTDPTPAKREFKIKRRH